MGESSRRRSSRSRSPVERRHAADRERDSDRRRHRSRSPDDRHHKKRKEDREEDEDDGKGPPEGVAEIDADAYFLKSAELKLWLDEDKGKRLDQLSGVDARKYFKKFCRAWNKGRLAPKFYLGISAASLSASLSSGYSWSFSKATQRELDDASSIRKSIDSTGGRPGPHASSSSGPPRRQQLGPTFPPPPGSALTALQNSREEVSATLASTRELAKGERRKANREGREEERDERATGKDRVQEKRREVNGSNREMREAREGGGMVEVDDDTLMGTGGSFQAMVNARDRSKTGPPGGRRQQAQEERAAVMTDKVKAFRTKEDDTMAMFRQLAAERFGPKPAPQLDLKMQRAPSFSFPHNTRFHPTPHPQAQTPSPHLQPSNSLTLPSPAHRSCRSTAAPTWRKSSEPRSSKRSETRSSARRTSRTSSRGTTLRSRTLGLLPRRRSRPQHAEECIKELESHSGQHEKDPKHVVAGLKAALTNEHVREDVKMEVRARLAEVGEEVK